MTSWMLGRKMKVTIEKLTDVSLLQEINECTMGYRKKSKQSLAAAYSTEHSTIRSQLFIVRLYDIPNFVAMHFRTHSATGQLIWTSSGRPDLGAKKGRDRDSLTQQIWIVNAGHLIDMSHWRLCSKASKETREVMYSVREELYDIDPALSKLLVPRCIYLSRCAEPKSCGVFKAYTEMEVSSTGWGGTTEGRDKDNTKEGGGKESGI